MQNQKKSETLYIKVFSEIYVSRLLQRSDAGPMQVIWKSFKTSSILRKSVLKVKANKQKNKLGVVNTLLLCKVWS